ncbi:MAG: phosphogluconate dehydratase, partial [Paraglaciecola sp.]
TLCVDNGELELREAKVTDVASHQIGMGREMFAGMRAALTGAEQGACSLFVGQEEN